MISSIPSRITKPLSGARVNPLHPLSRGLVAHWLFNEGSGSRTRDISGYGNHGTLTNMLPNTQGSGWGGSKFGGSLWYDGVDDYVECGSNPIIDDINQGTWSAWIYPIGWGHDNRGMIMSKSEAETTVADKCNNLQIRNAAGNGEETLNFDIFFDTTECRARAVDNSISLNEWTHVLVVWDLTEKTADMYINGDEVTYATHQTGVGTYVSTAGETQLIGATSYVANGGNRWFDGIIDIVSIYNRNVTTAEIKTLSQDPFCNILRSNYSRYYVAPTSGNPFWYYNMLRSRR